MEQQANPVPYLSGEPTLSLEFQYSLLDYREAMTVHRGQQIRQSSNRKSIGWAIGGTLCAVSLTMATWGQPLTLESIRSRIIAMSGSLLAWLPWIGIVVLLIGFGKSAARGVGAARKFLIALAALVILAAIALSIINSHAPPATGNEFSFGSLFSWVLLVLMWWLLMKNYLGIKPYERLWNGQPNLHLPKRVSFHIDGMSIGDTLSFSMYHWPAFARVAETPNLFLIYVGRLSFHMIPKRALGAMAVDEFRSMLKRCIESRTQAFPVMRVEPIPQSAETPRDGQPPRLAQGFETAKPEA